MPQKILALDIGGSKIMAAIADIRTEGSGTRVRGTCQLSSVEKQSLPVDATQEQLLSDLRELIAKLGPVDSCDAVGVNVPGLADPKTGMWVFAPFSGIRDLPIAEIIADWTGLPIVAIENDVNACAYAEKLFGICGDVDDFLWMTISNGIGGGLVLNGDIYRGHFGNAGEIGHFIVVENGSKCGCGNHGCLEVEAAGPAIARRFSTMRPRHKPCGAAEIAELARKGDDIALGVLETSAQLIGTALGNAANLINPAKIVIGGGVSGAFDLLAPEIRRSFKKHAFWAANEHVAIEKTSLGYEAALIGAAAIGFRSLQKRSR